MNDEVRDILYVAQSATAENFKQYAGFADMGGMPVTVEVVGTIKWFDVTKGFGFIVPDQGGEDVLVHISCLRKDGFETAFEGAKITCEAVKSKRGWQVVRVIALDTSTALHPSQMPMPRTHATVVPISGLERMVVKWFNRLRGFGFVHAGEGYPDIFVHMEILRRFGFAELKPGQEVLVRYGYGSKGLMVAEVRPVDGLQPPASH
jgi:CspA family cold shock protein